MEIVKTKSFDGFEFMGLLSNCIGSKKLIIHIHGMAGDILVDKYHPSMHTYYPQHGISFLACENRGTGTATEFNTDRGVVVVGNAYEKFEDCVIDIQAWIDYAEDCGYEEIWLQGHSLGASKVSYFMSRNKPSNVKGLILISPSDTVGLTRDLEGNKDHRILFPEAKRLVSEGNADTLLSHNLWGSEKLSAGTYINFFGEGTNLAIFNYCDDSLGWSVINMIGVPVLALTGTNDDGIVPVIDASEAMEKLESELRNCPKIKTIVYDGAKHGFEGFENTLVKDIVDFIKE